MFKSDYGITNYLNHFLEVEVEGILPLQCLLTIVYDNGEEKYIGWNLTTDKFREILNMSETQLFTYQTDKNTIDFGNFFVFKLIKVFGYRNE